MFAQISDISPVDIGYKKMVEEMNGTGSPRSGVDWATNGWPVEDYNGQ